MSEIIERIRTRYKILVWLTIAFIGLTILTVLLVDDFIRDVILVPFAYYLWLANIIINALPQNCFVSLLVILSLIVAIPSLRKRRQTVWNPKSSSEHNPGEVALWVQRLQYLKAGSYTGNRFAYHLGHLVVQILAYEERLTTREVINALEAGEFLMPENVRKYILGGIGSSTTLIKRSPWRQVSTWIKRVFKPGQHNQSQIKFNEIKAVLHFIEQKLKIDETLSSNHVSISESTHPEVNDGK